MRASKLRFAVLASLLCCMFGIIPIAQAEMATPYSQADTVLKQSSPTSNYGTATAVFATTLSNGSSSNRPVIQFDLSSVHAAVNSAKLQIFCQGSNATVTAYRVTGSGSAFVETGATWNKYNSSTNWTNAGGDYDNTVSASATTGTGSPFYGWITLDVTDLVQDMMDNSQTTGAFLFCSDKTGTSSAGGDGTYVAIRMKESTGYAAKLIINSTDQPNMPTVTAISGTVSDGEHLTISGSCFGTGPNVVLFDDFASGTDGQTMSTTATVGTWSDASGKIFADASLSNGKGIRVVDTTQLTSTVTFTQSDKVYTTFTGYVPDGYKFPYTSAEETYPNVSSLKVGWLMYGSDGYSNATKPDHVLTTWTGSLWYTLASNDSTGGISSFDQNTKVGFLWDTPVRWAFWAKGNGTTLVGSDGFFQSTNGTEQINRNYTNYKAWFNTDHTVQAWDRINFVGYLRTGTGYTFADGVNFVIDDIYVATGDNAQARVEIGNAATYAACTKFTLVTTGGNGDSWSSTSITATIREGTFTQAELETGYLYVTNGDGVTNKDGFSMEALSYHLTVNSGTGDGDYTESTEVNIAADAPATGYAFDCWTGDTSGIADVNDPTTTFTMSAANASVTATYEAVPHSLTVNSGTGDGNYTIGTVVNIDADAAATGYVFDCWTGDTSGVYDVDDPTTTITMPAVNTTITASYVAVPHSLTVTSGTGDGNYTIGEEIEIAADAPATGYVFDCWTGDTTGIADIYDPTTTITMPAANTAITASYVASTPEEITVYTQADCGLSQQYPTTNYSTGSYHYPTLLSNNNKSSRTLLQFDVSDVHPQVNSATLRLYCAGSGATVTAYRMTNPAWSEAKTTWNNFDKDVPTAWTTAGGDFDNSVSASATTGSGSPFVGWLEIDVTDLVQDMIDNDQATGSFLMCSDKTGTGTSGGDGTYVSIRTKEYSSGTYKAQLIIESQE